MSLHPIRLPEQASEQFIQTTFGNSSGVVEDEAVGVMAVKGIATAVRTASNSSTTAGSFNTHDYFLGSIRRTIQLQLFKKDLKSCDETEKLPDF